MRSFARGFVLVAPFLFCAACRKDPAPEKVGEVDSPPALIEPEAEPSSPAELPPGPRTPSSEAFGFAIGKDTRSSVDARLAALGLECGDTGPRALAEKVREKKRAELEQAQKTSDADAVSGASVLEKKSPREANPQIRLECANVRLGQFGLERQADASGRVLVIFDDPDAPLRHVSSRRSHLEVGPAVADIEEAVAAWTAVLGPPAMSEGDLGGLAPPNHTNNYARRQWKYADFVVEIDVLSYAGKRFSVSERAEVPVGVRADAPMVARGPQDSEGAAAD